MYAIQATITLVGDWRTDEFEETRQVPTFYLDERVQGILSADHAVQIAQSIIDPFGHASKTSITAVQV